MGKVKQRYRKVKLTGMNIIDSRTGQAAVAFWRHGHLYVVPMPKAYEGKHRVFSLRNKLKQVI